jgi:hypothetical protein
VERECLIFIDWHSECEFNNPPRFACRCGRGPSEKLFVGHFVHQLADEFNCRADAAVREMDTFGLRNGGALNVSLWS